MNLAHQVYLLDTHILLAAIIAPQRLTADVTQLLRDPANSIHFSVASIWEIAIKQSLGRDTFDFDPLEIHQLALETGFAEVPILSEHCHAIANMPWHHRDPFDRMLVAQARTLSAYLLTADHEVTAYGDLVVKVTVKGN